MPRLILIILDGFGVGPRNAANPRTRAKTPTFDRIEQDAFAVTLQASGVGVGLPWGEPGNSEAGHMTIGAGRILYHYLPRIVVAIREGSFFTNPAFKSAFAHARKTGGKLHAMGLISSGSVHAYVDHLYAFFEMAQREGVPLLLHVFTDGRDAEPKEAGKFLPQIAERMRALNVGRIASVCGRNFAMDRDGQWKKTERAYRLLTRGEGERMPSVGDALFNAYRNGTTDEFVPPTVIADENEPLDALTVRSGDALIFLNFREDSARQISEAFGAKSFTHFPREELQRFRFVTMTEYLRGLDAEVAFSPIIAEDTFGETLSRAGLSQLRIAETDKYAHVTYFFNGSIEEPFPREERMLIPSISDQPADAVPEMRASAIADAIVRAIEGDAHDVIIANFANADMVGHTGNFASCVKALEALDQALGRVLASAQERGVAAIVTADHGNVEEKIDLRTGHPLTEHSINPVPFLVLGRGVKSRPLPPASFDVIEPAGLLTDIAPTALALLRIPIPKRMTGQNLLR